MRSTGLAACCFPAKSLTDARCVDNDMHETAPKLSIVIRCRNEARALRDVLEALHNQRCDFGWEVIVVDNESVDETSKLCKKYRTKVVSISSQEFTYGRALNWGIAASRGELVLLLSAHALPVGSHFLESAIAPFSDPQVAAARCTPVHMQSQMVQWYQPTDIQYASAQDQREAESRMDWLRKYPTAACGVLRRSVWEQIKFDETLESNEDKLWGSQVLAKGYKIWCPSEAFWIYTRTYSKREHWKRDNRQQLSLYRITRRAPLPWSSFLMRVAKGLLSTPFVIVRHWADTLVPNWLLATIPLQAKAQPRKGSMPEFRLEKSSDPRRETLKRDRPSGRVGFFESSRRGRLRH